MTTIREMHDAYISVGSNIGKKQSNCRRGVSELTAHGKVTLLNQSRYYRTEPVDYSDQDWFVNGIVKIRTELSPEGLLKRLKQIEKNAGRSPGVIRFGPRVLDMDIIFYDELVMVSSGLVVPHPKMHKRRFVLRPICDINPDVIHPVLKKTANDLLNRLHVETQKVAVY